MPDQLNQTISDIMDQPADAGRRQALFARIKADHRACRVWQRYHLIGCVLRGEVENTGADLSERIRAQLDAEPTVLAPAARHDLAESTQETAGQGARRFTRKSAGWLALAASVAIVAVITLRPADEANLRLADTTEPASALATAARSVAVEQEFGEMLTRHGEFTSSLGLNGLVVYAKLVSNEPIHR